MIEKGILGHREQMVTPDLTADRIGSGLVQVFATPMLVALMEQTCNESVTPLLEAGQGTVGTHIDISHSAATPVGERSRSFRGADCGGWCSPSRPLTNAAPSAKAVTNASS